MPLHDRPRRRANIRANDPRLRVWNDKPIRSGDYVVYWCQANRRAIDNVALEYAVKRANELHLPLIVYEALRPDYPHASARFHKFVLECGRDNARVLASRGIAHGFFLPRTAEQAKGVAAKVFARAALIVSDEHPSFIHPWQNSAGARYAPCTYLTVDDAAIAPLALIPAHEPQARTIRPKLLALLDEWLAPVVLVEPQVQAPSVEWPFDPLDLEQLDLDAAVARCAIDQSIAPISDRPGGSRAAWARLSNFLAHAARGYDGARDDPSEDGTSGLSPYLHFGAISARSCALAARDAVLPKPALDAFLEQLVVRRGLAFNHAAREPRHATYEAVPAWARDTLAEHASDPRPDAKPPATLERAKSADDVWNAAQRELILRGRIHNVVRMFWGKRIITMVKRPRDAFELAVRMMDRYALDGRDPNTYAGVAWCFGLHDRPFPERPIFGTVRSMGVRALEKRFDVSRWVESIPPLKKK
ncbi:MAG: deoxyribodipyrimidine photolyase [Deltaproteobacteria bacterium]|nr:deoxyribodipyrimidine photolyase [Deltaproteobacteria bacterium]